jgi:two-component system LytT family response regulator
VLKPFHRQRIAEALARVRRQRTDGGAAPLDARSIQELIERGRRPVDYRSRILVRAVGRVRFVPVAGVQWFEADGNYVRLHTATDSHLVRATMRSLEQELDPAIFVRIHRSTIVNLQFLRELRRRASGDHQLELDSGVRLTLSRSYRESFERAVAGRPELSGD